MKAKILIVGLITVIAAGCSKDQFSSTPHISLKSVSPLVLSANQVITFDINFTDAEGDVQDTIWVQKVTSNCTASNFTQAYKIPSFTPTKDLSGVFQVTFAYGINLGYPPIKEPQCNPKNDTCVFKFWMQDVAKHKSDTITTPTIVLIKR